ncbi:MAG: TRAP transporter small permease [Myxococcales bacterium]|nr:TRAP transporter small permease [Myxococcales bacterium]
MNSFRNAVDKLDDAVLAVERVLLLATLSLMTLLVSLDVVQRTFSRPVSKTASVILGFMSDPSAETRALVIEKIGPWLFTLGSLVFVMLAVHSSRSIKAERLKTAMPGVGLSLGIGLGIWVALGAAIQGLLAVFPSSLPGAQKFSLGLMLWSGMLGASIATRQRRHIVLDTVRKSLDEKTGKLFSLVGGLVTFGFCSLFTVLALTQLHDEFALWRDGDGVGVFDALPIPKWVVTLAIPVTFGTMALRFLGAGVRDFVWGPPTGGVDAHGVDMEQLAKDAEQVVGAKEGA